MSGNGIPKSEPFQVVHQLKTNSAIFSRAAFMTGLSWKLSHIRASKLSLSKGQNIDFDFWTAIYDMSVYRCGLTATFNLLCGWIACWFAREPFVVSWCHYCAASHYDANRFALIAAKRAKVEMKIASKGMSDAGRQRNNVGAAPLSPRFKDRRRDPRDAALRDDSGWRNACIRGVPAHACDALILFRTGSFPENARA